MLVLCTYYINCCTSLKSYADCRLYFEKMSQRTVSSPKNYPWKMFTAFRSLIWRVRRRLLGKIHIWLIPTHPSGHQLLSKNADNYRTQNTERDYSRAGGGVDGDLIPVSFANSQKLATELSSSSFSTTVIFQVVDSLFHSFSMLILLIFLT